MEILTLGFTKRSARSFFDALKAARVTRLVDVRLNNVSQLAGFTKRDDLAYFLKEICGVDYVHELMLAPTQHLLDDYKKHRVPWSEYERSFLSLMAERRIEDRIPRALFDGRAVLLCSEPTADHCHRRLVAEYLRDHWGDVEVTHL
jgi:uncharacterized protein (DUF488 family)